MSARSGFLFKRAEKWLEDYFFEISIPFLFCQDSILGEYNKKWGISKDIHVLILSFQEQYENNKRCDHRATHQDSLL